MRRSASSRVATACATRERTKGSGGTGQRVDDLQRALPLELGLVEERQRPLALLVPGGGVGHGGSVLASAWRRIARWSGRPGLRPG